MPFEIGPLNPNGPRRSVREKAMDWVTHARAAKAKAAA